ncbi:short-chain dehydrogenase [Luteitalea sp. TBR-22]|uniref:oxidoreductase n=1 Tax=Luteitalea sp. TBR-22 TaxID=2802971 RepID=UPI001AF94884|nr:oxidoreductase [Luteitalea sp. TBR-22]BCS32954.1 short-chain dehydrogenase [Luteitalea sp. TBR-22]
MSDPTRPNLPHAFDLTGRVALVTGSTSGIGKGIAFQLAALGASVMVTGRSREAGQGVLAAIGAAGGRADFEPCDLVDEASCRRLVEATVARFGHLDILVNNAADTSRGDVRSTRMEDWDRIFAINVRAPFVLMQAAVPHLEARGGGAILNVGSVNAYIGEPKLTAYSASKGALQTLTKNAAAQLNAVRIRVNQINAGWTLTEGERKVKREQEGKGDEWVAEAVATRPFGRLLEPADIAYAVAYYVSDAAACVTGSVMDLEQYPVGAPPAW